MSSTISVIIQGLGQGFVDSLNFAAFLSYCLRSKALLDLALFAFLMNAFVLISLLGMEWLFSSPSQNDNSNNNNNNNSTSTSGGTTTTLLLATQVAWQIPMKLVVDIFGVGGWSLYNQMYSAAFAEAKNRKNANLGAAPEKVRSRVSVGEKINRSATLVVVTLYKPLLMMWISYAPTIVPEWILMWIFPAMPIQKAVSWILFLLAHVLIMVLDTMAYSFFCFEPRMSTIVNAGRVLPLSDQLKWFEYQWPYFVGYGLVQFVANFALINIAKKSIIANAVFSTLNPIHVVTSLGAISDPGPTCRTPFPIFTWTCKLWNGPLQSLVKKAVSSKQLQERRKQTAGTDVELVE